MYNINIKVAANHAQQASQLINTIGEFNFRELEFKIDTRIPLELFRKAPFVYTGPDFKSFPHGIISNTINYRGRKVERFYPLTVSKVSKDKLLTDQFFCYSFFYVTDKNELALFLSHPFWFNRSESQAVFDFFITKIEDLAEAYKSKFIEVELHDDINSSVAFPTSLSHFSYELNKRSLQIDDLALFHRYGFQNKKTILCSEQSIDEVEKKVKDEEGQSYHIQSINLTEFMKLRHKTSEFQSNAYTLSNRDPTITHKNIPFFQETLAVAYRRSRWFPLKTKFEGFVRWYPNLLEPFDKHHTPLPLLFPYIYESYPFTYGKIFDWSLKTEDVELFTGLLSHAIHSMKQKGLKKCQISYFSNEQTGIERFLDECGFRAVHTMKLLKKRVD